MRSPLLPVTPPSVPVSRREFLVGATSLALTAPALWSAGAPAPTSAGRRVRVGVVGLGGRGAWIASLFQAHGGFEVWSVADYFPEVAEEVGARLGVAPERRFSRLAGYQRLMDSGVEAMVLEAIPYFYPEHARAAVERGLHVYMAKPVAVDVPGALAVLAQNEQATRQGRVFLVDYQMPTDPYNAEVVARIQAGALGKIAHVQSMGSGGPLTDPALTGSLESRMRNLIWVSDAELGCDHLGNYGIHALDAVIWALGQRPVAATGASRRTRPDPQGNSCDVNSVVYEYADGTVHNHFGQALTSSGSGDLSATFYGQSAQAVVSYWGNAYVRGGPKPYRGGAVANLYEAGAQRNIARFHQEVTQGKPVNDTCARAVDGVLASLLGQQAGARGTRVTLEQLLAENRPAKVDLTGLA